MKKIIREKRNKQKTTFGNKENHKIKQQGSEKKQEMKKSFEKIGKTKKQQEIKKIIR